MAVDDAPARAAEPLAAPTGEPILIVTGAIAVANGEYDDAPAAIFDAESFAKLPTTTIRTSTHWTDGVSKFEGPRARDVLTRVGVDVDAAEPGSVRAIAINDYAIDIPISDFRDYDILMATRMDDKVLTLRDKGPIWIVYPRDDHAELSNSLVNSRWVWQLKRIDVQQ